MSKPKSRPSKDAEKFFDHVSAIAGRPPSVYLASTEDAELVAYDRATWHSLWSAEEPAPGSATSLSLPPVFVLVCDGFPEGCMTAFSWGLSAVGHPEWKLGRPEALVSVEGNDLRWAGALGQAVVLWRRENLFRYGTILQIEGRLVESHDMTGFLVEVPLALDAPDRACQLPSGLKLNLVQLYPIRALEAQELLQLGFRGFMDRYPDLDFADINRPPIVEES